MLGVEGFEDDDSGPVAVWLAEVRRRMMRVFSESNFYNSIAVSYLDLAVFGTAPMLIYEDYENVVQFYNPCAGEYYCALDDRLMVDTLAREMVQTAPQLRKWFGKENVSEDVKRALQMKGASSTQEYAVCHVIKPNFPGSGVPKHFKYAEFYYERGAMNGSQGGGSNQDKYLRIKGYFSKPFVCIRWDVSGNDPYGRSPGMDALGDIKQLQQEQKRKAQAIDKLANPPMVADVELKNQPASTIPGGVTYVGKKDGVGFKPAYENFRPPINEIMTDIQEVQQRIKAIFFNDLFLMFQQMQAEPRSAAAIDARREEKMVMLGPVLERFQNEGLDPIIDRVFDIMWRGGLLPPPPPEIHGKQIQVTYVSMLAAAQKAMETGGIERLFATVGNLAAIHPEALDIPNWDFAVEEYSRLLGNDPRLINDDATIKQLRDAKRQQQQMQFMTELGQGAAKAGKTLADTPVGGGASTALDALTGANPQ